MAVTTPRIPTPWSGVAAGVRREVKARAAELGLPATVTVRVTSEGFAGGASVDVHLSGDPSWAWTVCEHADAYHAVGDKVLSAAARTVGAAIGEIIRARRDAADVGYVWGSVDHDGTTLASVARRGFVPGQD